ncbi:hypothetical protein WJX74_004030 [Apatococcus lobatus]|uniref:Pyruvate kinase n=1 Tax=Apatococcus lobatus TaxID=904363 RepID=A0AAW1S2T2_9CHLO
MTSQRSQAASVKLKTHFFDDLNLGTILEPAPKTTNLAGTKVIATLGPSCHEYEVLVEMLQAGMSCARVDLTWGPVEYHMQSLRNLQRAVRKTRRLCAIIIDTLGRELFVRRSYSLDETGWPAHDEPIRIKQGQRITMTVDPKAECTQTLLPVGFAGFVDMCRPGDQLFLGRYLASGAEASSLYLQVEEVAGQEVICTAQNDADLTGLLTVLHQDRVEEGISSTLDMPLLSEHDTHALQRFSEEFEIDFVASACCSAADVAELRTSMDSMGLSESKIMGKAENREGLQNFEAIAALADAMVFSRGNLGLDVAPEKMALVQKSAISRCNLLGCPVVITRLVDTMISAPRPTRAEATDVANAVLDGVDAMLLGAETLRGGYPVETLQTVLSICRQAEVTFDYTNHFDFLMSEMLMADMDADIESETPMAGDSPRQSTSAPQLYPHAEEDGIASSNGDVEPSDDSVFLPKNTLHVDIPATRSGDDDKSGLSPGSSAKHARSHAEFSNTKGTQRQLQGFTGQMGSSANLRGLQGGGGSGTPAAGGSRRNSAGAQGLDGAMDRHSSLQSLRSYPQGAPNSLLQKIESMASTAVRAAAKIKASLIIVYSSTGRTARLVAKYRPSMPILTLVIPHLTATNSLKWQLGGRSLARQTLIIRGVVPMLAAPMPGSSDFMLSEAVRAAAARGLVEPNDHIVCLMSVRDDVVLKIVSVDSLGIGLKPTHRQERKKDEPGADLPNLGKAPSRSLPANLPFKKQSDAGTGASLVAAPEIAIEKPPPIGIKL